MDYVETASELIEKMGEMNRIMLKSMPLAFWKGESYILMYLSKAENASPGEISGAMKISSARVAVTLNALEKKGLIHRQICTADRRKIQVSLTEEGKLHIDAQEKLLHDSMEKLLRGLGDRDASEYLRITKRIIELSEKTMTINDDKK